MLQDLAYQWLLDHGESVVAINLESKPDSVLVYAEVLYQMGYLDRDSDIERGQLNYRISKKGLEKLRSCL